MRQTARFAFAERKSAQPGISNLPYMPVLLQTSTQVVTASGLVDSGAAMSVLPYSLGEQLGFVWEQQKLSLQLTGNLSQAPARVIIVEATVALWPPVRLVFAWTQKMTCYIGSIQFLR